MGFIVGFGKVEIDTAKKIISECQDAIGSNGKDAQSSLAAIEKKYADDAERFKKMDKKEAPERYTRFWCSHHDIYKGKYMVEFTMHHINRRHAFSPDGWALLVTRWILSVCPVDGVHVFKEA